MSSRIEDVFADRPMVPVLTITDAALALPLARALAAGGLDVLEITLRTRQALDAVSAIRSGLAEVTVGVGTVLSAAQLLRARDAGAAFAVSPGYDPALADAASVARLPLLPGVATASEAMAARGRGFRLLKFFPAEPMGGVATLQALAPIFPDLRFCPTGGIDAARAPGYLALDNVAAVGGSWVAPARLVRSHDWPAITALARAAAALRR